MGRRRGRGISLTFRFRNWLDTTASGFDISPLNAEPESDAAVYIVFGIQNGANCHFWPKITEIQRTKRPNPGRRIQTNAAGGPVGPPFVMLHMDI